MRRKQICSLVIAVALVAACAHGPERQPADYRLLQMTPAAGGDIKPFWSTVVLIAAVRRIDWRDLEWSHVETVPGAIYSRERSGGDVHVGIVLLDGTTIQHTVKKGQKVSVTGGELRLP